MLLSIMPQLVLVVIRLVFILKAIEAARILAVFPFPSFSHQIVFRPLTQELARRGHEVIVITPDPAFPKGQAPANLTEIDVHDLSYQIWTQEFAKSLFDEAQNDLEAQLSLLLNSGTKIVDQQLQHEEVRKMIADKTKKFDLLLLEACVRSSLIYSYIYKDVPVIQISSFGAIIGNYEAVGAPINPLIYPVNVSQRLINFTVWEKIIELYSCYFILKAADRADSLTNAMFQKHFGSDAPKVGELVDNVHMLFLNIHSLFEGIRPVPPSVVYMGGLHQNPGKQLPTDLKNYLDSSKNGVIYMSFGTNVDPTILPPEKIQIFVRVFSQLPYDILVKWSTEEIPGRTDNIRISKWLPQSDLLKHPNMKLFITQGGLQSTDEAISAGVPLIGVPMLGDQWFNVRKYAKFGIGVGLQLETLTAEQLRNEIERVINDESYKRNVIKLRDLLNDQPQRPLERAVWWTEHLLRHGGAKHLRSPAANMSWTEYLELELVLTIVLLLLTIITLIVISLYCLCRKLKSLLIPVKTKQL